MSVAEILEQIRTMSREEREELLAEIQALQNVQDDQEAPEADEHWGKSLNLLMDEIGVIEMKYPEIEDPVEWLKHLRTENRRRRLGDWGENVESEKE